MRIIVFCATLLCFLYACTCSDDSFSSRVSVDELLEEARGLLRNGQISLARDCLTVAAVSAPTLSETWYLLSNTSFELGFYEDAISQMSMAAEMDPVHYGPYFAGVCVALSYVASADVALSCQAKLLHAVRGTDLELPASRRYRDTLGLQSVGVARDITRLLLDDLTPAQQFDTVMDFLVDGTYDVGDTSEREAVDKLRTLLKRRVSGWHIGMLNDVDRNSKYRRAIHGGVRAAYRHFGRRVVVLDIGAGSGILAMIAAEMDEVAHVYTVEANDVIAHVASRIVAFNGLSHKITILHKMSTDVVVGPQGDIHAPADMLLSEIIDSVLLGEDIIPTYEHALTQLVRPDAVILPRRGVLQLYLADSPHLSRRTVINPNATLGFDVSPLNSYHFPFIENIRVSTVGARALTEPIKVFSFDFTKPVPYPSLRKFEIPVVASGTAHVGVISFELHLDDNPSNVIDRVVSSNHMSTHWTQGVVHFGQDALSLKKGDAVSIFAAHDERFPYFFTFSADSQNTLKLELEKAVDLFKIGIQRTPRGNVLPPNPAAIRPSIPYSTFWQLNDREWNEAFAHDIRTAVRSRSNPVVLCVGDGGSALFSLVAADAGAATVYAIEPHGWRQKPFEDIVKKNNMGHVIRLVQGLTDSFAISDILSHVAEDREKTGDIAYKNGHEGVVDVVVAAPLASDGSHDYNYNPFTDLLKVSYGIAVARSKRVLPTSASIVPAAATVWAVIIHSDLLRDSRGHVKFENTQGFNVSMMDHLMGPEAKVLRTSPSDYHLASQPFRCTELDMAKGIWTSEALLGPFRVSTSITLGGSIHGVLFWPQLSHDPPGVSPHHAAVDPPTARQSKDSSEWNHAWSGAAWPPHRFEHQTVLQLLPSERVVSVGEEVEMEFRWVSGGPSVQLL